MELDQRSLDALRVSGIPLHMHDTIIDYYKHGWQPGGFLTAFINNDLKETFAHADPENAEHIRDYVMWFYNHAPGGTWGRPNAMQDYIGNEENFRCPAA